jgi:signal transduction histidine kinase
MSIRAEETHVHPDVILQDISSNQLFFEKHMAIVLQSVYTLLFYGTEEAIKAGDHIYWREHIYDGGWYYDYNNRYPPVTPPANPTPSPGYGYDYGDDRDIYDNTYYFPPYYDYDDYDNALYLYEWDLSLWRTDGFEWYSTINLLEASTAQANLTVLKARHEQRAINQQLVDFRLADTTLRNTNGLLFFIESKSDNESLVHSNVAFNHQTEEYFTSQPVFFVMNNGLNIDQSHFQNYIFYPFDHLGWVVGDNTAYVAFTPEIVNAFNATYLEARTGYIIDMSIIAVCVVLGLLLLAVLLAGAGRKTATINSNDGVSEIADGDSSKRSVYFSLIDKPYLDLSLALLIGWVMLIFAFVQGFEILDIIWRHRNISAMNIFLATTIVLVLIPTLLWFLNFVKRTKAGNFWKHTLIYANIKLIMRVLNALWAGIHLTGKVIVISITAYIMFLIISSLSYSRQSFLLMVFTVAFIVCIIICLSLYAKRIRKLDIGAQKASSGDYSTPIDVGGGELGRIAHSINNISTGISSAVEERLKSERLKTELITNVSHDIRTPLTSLITYTDLLKHEGLDSKKAPEYLDILIQKSQRLKSLTDELFEAAKAVTGNIDVTLTQLDIISLINQVLGELDGSIKSSGLDLRINLPEKLSVRADGRLMWRVLENLMFNVFKFSLPNSRVYIDAVRYDEHYARIDIKNISAAALNFDPSELTERFKRGDDSRSDGGAGLGLSIVQSFVAAQHGWFTISIDGDLFKATVMLPLS